MLGVLVGATLATALLYIGRCWGKQERAGQDIKFSMQDYTAPIEDPPFSQSDFDHLKRTGRATVLRRGKR